MLISLNYELPWAFFHSTLQTIKLFHRQPDVHSDGYKTI